MFGLHSLRVTACNELDRLGVTDTFIQRRLRWKSMTFAMYLRNTIYAARRHNLSNIHASPHDRVLTAACLTHPPTHVDLPPQPTFL
jgi:PIN domain nuclease of toxin-antitoxin system